MAQVAISGFVNTWAPAFSSTLQRVDVRNIRQGGNDLLAAFPLALQATFASSVMASVAAAVAGPFALLARFFQILFSPFISFPLAIISCAAKEGFYEESVKASAAVTTQFFVASQEGSPEQIRGTVTLQVDGVERHFILDGRIDWYVESTVEVDGARHWFHELADGEIFNDQCREVEINGRRVQVKLECEAGQKKFIEQEQNGVKHYFELGAEVAAPIRGTITVRTPIDQMDWRNPVWERHYFLNTVPNETPNCTKIKSTQQTFYYDTGEEISSPEPGSRTFIINGVARHFASATCVRSPSSGLSTGLNAITDKLFGVSLLPTRLSAFAATALSLVNQYMSEVVRIALIVSGLGFLYFGATAMAAGALAAVVYETLDHDLGIIPHKVSLFMEEWMPMLSSVGLLIVGSIYSQVLAAASLAMMIPSVQLWVHEKVSALTRKAMIEVADSLISWFAARQGDERRPRQIDELLASLRAAPSLEECHAPFEQRKGMAFTEINEILNGEDNGYELNPAGLTKEFKPVLQLAENRDFNILMRLWDERADRWIQSYPLFLNQLADDEKFIKILKARIPGARSFFFEYDPTNHHQNRTQQYAAAQTQYRQDVEAWITTLAEEQNISKEQFVVNFVRSQLQAYVEKLSGTRPIEGERWLLEDTIEDTSKIIPLLLDPNTTALDIESSLRKLAIEAGDYCALGMQRASREVLESFTEPLILQQFDQMPPNERFEKETLWEFQRARLRAIQGFYSEATSFLRGKEQFRSTADDIHLYTFASTALKQGFYPLAPEETYRLSIPHLLFSDTLLFPFKRILMEEFMERVPENMNAMSIDRRNWFDGGPLSDGRGRQLYVDTDGRMLYQDNQGQEQYVLDMDGEVEYHDYRTAPNGQSRAELRLEAPHNRTLNYLRSWVQTNSQLTDLEKEQLLGGPFAQNNDQLRDLGNPPKWNRLFLNILGIYRKKAVQPAESEAAEPAATRNPPQQLVVGTV